MKHLFAALSITLLLGITPALAAPPATISYQGYLTDSGGVAINSTVSMVLSLYSVASSGSALWTETQPNVVVTKGVYTVQLGSITTLNLPFDTTYYLGVAVGGDAQMTPRLVLTSAPTVFRAMSADKLNQACANNEILKYVAASSTWSCAALPGGGTVTSVTVSAPLSVANGTSTPAISLGIVPLANGGTGTTTGSITGTAALTFTAGGTNSDLNLLPTGTGSVTVGSKRITGLATPTGDTDATTKAYVDSKIGAFGTNTSRATGGQAYASLPPNRLVGDVWLSASLGWKTDSPSFPCDGRSLVVHYFPKLFSVIQCNFGCQPNADPYVFTFQLPDLRAAAPNGLTYMISVDDVDPDPPDTTVNQ